VDNLDEQNLRSGVEAAVLSRMLRGTLARGTRAATPSIAGGMLLQFC